MGVNVLKAIELLNLKLFVIFSEYLKYDYTFAITVTK